MTTPPRYRGELSEDEERRLLDPENWDDSRAELLPGVSDPKIVFRVELDHAQMVALSAIHDRDKANLVDLIQRYVDERIAAEYAAVTAADPELAETA